MGKLFDNHKGKLESMRPLPIRWDANNPHPPIEQESQFLGSLTNSMSNSIRSGITAFSILKSFDSALMFQTTFEIFFKYVFNVT